MKEEFCEKYWVPLFAAGNLVEADRTFLAPPVLTRVISRLQLKYVLSAILLIALTAMPAIIMANIACERRWLLQTEYDNCFSDLEGSGRFARVNYGKVNWLGNEVFRAEWIALPQRSFCWSSRSYMTYKQFLTWNDYFLENNYELQTLNHFTDTAGYEIYQGTWTRKGLGDCS